LFLIRGVGGRTSCYAFFQIALLVYCTQFLAPCFFDAGEFGAIILLALPISFIETEHGAYLSPVHKLFGVATSAGEGYSTGFRG